MRFCVIIALLFSSQVGFGQSDEWDVDTGKMVMHMPVEVNALLERHKAYIRKIEGFPGYRIQIAATSTLREIKEVKKEFEEVFDDYHTYTVFTNPNYRLQVGDYRNRLEAHRDLIIIRKEFPQAFISRGPIDILAP